MYLKKNNYNSMSLPVPGWSSFYPSLTVVQHGIPCYEMQVGDLCLPPGHRDSINCDDSVVFDTFRRYRIIPMLNKNVCTLVYAPEGLVYSDNINASV